MYIVIPIEYRVEKTYNDSNNRLSISYINESNLNKDYYRCIRRWSKLYNFSYHEFYCMDSFYCTACCICI